MATQVFFTDSTGGNDPTPSNPLSTHYAPLQQLEEDLEHDRVADYTWITPDQYYKNDGAIIIWCDESESNAGENGDDFTHTIGEIVISPDAHDNDGAVPYASAVNFTHSSDLRTWEELFHLSPLLGDAVNASDLSDLFEPGAIKRSEDQRPLLVAAPVRFVGLGP